MGEWPGPCKILPVRRYTWGDDEPSGRFCLGIGGPPACRGPGARPVRLRAHRRHADGGADRARRSHRLVLSAAVRQRQRLRRHPRSGAGRHLVGSARSGLDLHPTLPAPHQHPRDHLPHRRRHRRADRFHAGGRGRPAIGTPPGDPPAAPLHPGPRADADDVHAPVRVRRARHSARAAPERAVRHRSHRPGAHPLQREAVRMGGRAVRRHRPVYHREGGGALAGPALRRRRYPPRGPL